MGELESRLDRIEDFLAKKSGFETPRIRAQKISKKQDKEHHVGKPSPEMISQAVNSFINEFVPKALSDVEKDETRKQIKEMVKHIETDIDDEDLKQNLTARLKQAYEKLESSK